jgi:Protein of unknown function (DUF2889)
LSEDPPAEAPGTDGREPPVVRIGDRTTPYRRRIRLVRIEPGVVWGGLEDDFHHFQVTLRHDGTHVTGITMHAERWPWATCPEAGRNLEALVGMGLSDRCTAVAAVTDPKMNCTHQFDLAGLCVTHAARDIEVRQYDVELPPPAGGELVPRLWVDGELALEFHLAADVARTRSLLGPPQFVDAPWRGGFMKWAEANLPAEEAEAAIVLRRSCDIGMGRGMDLEAIPVAIDLAEIMTGVCYSMQPEVMPVAFRNRGSIRDFGRHPDALLRGTPGSEAAPSAG